MRDEDKQQEQVMRKVPIVLSVFNDFDNSWNDGIEGEIEIKKSYPEDYIFYTSIFNLNSMTSQEKQKIIDDFVVFYNKIPEDTRSALINNVYIMAL